jgi:PEGA domain
VFRRALPVLLACLFAAVGVLNAENHIQAELRFLPHSNAEKNAGVWIDGQYVGYVKEVNGEKKMLLLPGKHEIVVRQAWYQDYVEHAVLEPREVHTIALTMVKDPRTPAKGEMAELKISADPGRAAVFLNDQFAGHADEFDGRRAMLVPPGEHRLRIALPGYLPFETVLNLRAKQKLKIDTRLLKGSITEAGGSVSR